MTSILVTRTASLVDSLRAPKLVRVLLSHNLSINDNLVTDVARAKTVHDSIVATGLTKSSGAVRAVRGIDLQLARGSTVALLGPNGAGKTTTIDMLIGLARPDAGTVSLFGRTPTEAVKAGTIGAMTQTGQ